MTHRTSVWSTFHLAKLLALTIVMNFQLHAQQKVAMSFEDIVQRLYGVEFLAIPPKAGEQSGCFSTYEKSSIYNSKTGLYENWFANKDSNGVYDGDGKGPHGTLCELEGPGVIWRIWSA